MTDNKHDNDIAGFSRRDIYTVPDGFFEAEKQRLSALARGPWQSSPLGHNGHRHRSRSHRMPRGDTAIGHTATRASDTRRHSDTGASLIGQPHVPRHAARND